jgi:acetylornithine aminotransferase
VLRVLAAEGLVERADVLGKTLSHGIESLRHRWSTTSAGLLRGVVLTAPHAKPSRPPREAGFLQRRHRT